MDPFSFAELHHWDVALLKYYLMLKDYYEQKAMDQMRKEAEDEEDQDRSFRDRLPKVRR